MSQPKGKIEAELGIDSRQSQWLGCKIGTVSVLVAFLGGGLAAAGLVTAGQVLAVVGIFGGFVGAIAHFVAMATGGFKSK